VLKPEYNICLDVVELPSRSKESRKKQSETRKQRFKEGKIIPTKTHRIFVYYKDGSFVGEFNTITDAAKQLNIGNPHRLYDTIVGRAIQCKGYKAFNEKQEFVEPFHKSSAGERMLGRRTAIYNLIDANTGSIVFSGNSDELSNFTNMKKVCLTQYVNNKNIKLKRKYYLCRVSEKSEILSLDKIGESCDANTEVSTEITKGSVPP